MIAACHRLHSFNRNKPPDVIVRFVNRKSVYLCHKYKNNLKNHVIPNLFIHENLCRSNQDIFDECQHLKRNNRLNKVWSKNGLIFFKRSANLDEKPTMVSHFDDLYNLFSNYYEDLEDDVDVGYWN